MADPKPELPEGWRYRDGYLHHLGWSLKLSQLRSLLASQGLHIVGAKDRALLESVRGK